MYSIKVHIVQQKALARFGFAHLMATNMCLWLRTLIMEIMEDMHHRQAETTHGADDGVNTSETGMKYAL